MRYYLSVITGLVLVLSAYMAVATPSTTYWTPAVSDVQAFGVWHIGVDNYFTMDKTLASGDQGDFPTDLGITVGVLPFKRIQMEVGVDALYPSDHPYYFNAKIGTPENAWFSRSPAVNLGIFNVGTERSETDYNMLDFVIGATLPWGLGRIHAGGYTGNKEVLISGESDEEASGWMVGYDRFLIKDKVLFAADYASGRNAIGGGGAGIYYFITKDISLLAGPVWFNDKELNGDTKWTVQLDINL